MAPPGLSTSPTRSTTAQSLLSSSAPNNPEPTPSDLLLATPPTILKLLAITAPIIHTATDACELVCWQKDIWSSLLLLLGWWALCLGGQFVARYGLNGSLLVFLLYRYISLLWDRPQQSTAKALPSYRRKPMTLTPASYSTLLTQSQTLATHVHSFRTAVVHPIEAQLSFIPPAANKPTPAYSLAWLALTSYPFYLALTWLVPLRLLFLVVGSIGILWQAPFFQALRGMLWRSAAVRWACRIGLALLRGGHGLKKEWEMTGKGVGLVGKLGGKQGGEVKVTRVRVASTAGGQVEEEDNFDTEGEDIQVQFTVFENQRWWVGLDWTHALLPGERASWTDPALNPANPPSSFILPPPSVVYTPSPTKSDPNSRLKRTTEWKWLDPEWAVLRTPSAQLIAAAAAMPTSPSLASLNGTVDAAAAGPASVAESAAGTPVAPSASKSSLASVAGLSSFASSNNLFSSLSPSLSGVTSSSTPTTTANGAPGSPTISQGPPAPLPVGSGQPMPGGPALGDAATWANWPGVDEEGWQYGDNHFEKMGPKGGLGKYTRKRAWVRRAGLVEKVERVPGDKDKGAIEQDGKDAVKTGERKPSLTGAGQPSTQPSGASTATASNARRSSMLGSMVGLGTNMGQRVGSLRERSTSGSRSPVRATSATFGGVGAPASPTKGGGDASGSLAAALGGGDVRRRKSGREREKEGAREGRARGS